MAKARMLHKKISLSFQVNQLDVQARLLFTWMIAHADDEGRLRGEPAYIKAAVVPMANWSSKKIETYLEAMRNVGLIYFWSKGNDKFVEFIKWKEYQSIKEDRFKSSNLPSYPNGNDSKLEPNRTQTGDKQEPQSNVTESNPTINKGEYNERENAKNFADNNSQDFTKIGEILRGKISFQPTNELEVAAIEVWNRLEPGNHKAFWTTYLAATKKGLPVTCFYQFASEIEQDPTIKNPGAIFNKKVEEYLLYRGSPA